MTKMGAELDTVRWAVMENGMVINELPWVVTFEILTETYNQT